MNKSLIYLLTLIFVSADVLLAIENSATPVSVHLLQTITGPISLSVVIVVSAIIAGLAVGICSLSWKAQASSEVKRSQLKQEKAQVQAEQSSDQVRVLQSKIDTLERALQTALAGKQGG